MYDVVCIGFGPANIALAIALDELWPQARVKFLEKSPVACWQPAMLLNGADIQNNPVRDLVTPRNPRSRYTFINYLHENGRLFQHLNLPGHYPLREEYARYIPAHRGRRREMDNALAELRRHQGTSPWRDAKV